jgi:hypothetical protein
VPDDAWRHGFARTGGHLVVSTPRDLPAWANLPGGHNCLIHRILIERPRPSIIVDARLRLAIGCAGDHSGHANLKRLDGGFPDV